MLTLRQLTCLCLEFLVHIAYFTVQAGILARQQVKLVFQLVQIDQPVLLGFGKLSPQTEDFLIQRSDLCLLLLEHHAVTSLMVMAAASSAAVGLVDTELVAADLAQLRVRIGVISRALLLLLVQRVL